MPDQHVAVDLRLRGGGRTATAVGQLPAIVWLSLIVLVSTGFRVALARTNPAPSVFPDEIIYSDLARSIGSSGHFLVRGSPFDAWTFGPLYALLVAPAFRIGLLPDAYLVAKVINCLAMSLAALPVYLIARRLLDRGLSYLAAGLSLLVPGMAFSSRIMTESLAYPVFLFCVLAMLRMLERPTASRQLQALGIIAMACAVRAQALVLLPALITVIVGQAALDLRAERSRGIRSLLDRLRAYYPLGALLVGSLAASIGVVLTGGSLGGSVLGRFEYVADRLDPVDLPKWLLYHVGELDLALGIIPFVGFVLFLRAALERNAEAPARSLALVAGATTAWMILLAAAFATQGDVVRVQERYVFYVCPLVIIAFLAWAAEGRSGRGRWMTASGIALALLPLLLPYDAVLNNHLFASTPGLVPWLYLHTLVGTVVVVVAIGVLCMLCGIAAARSRDRLRLVAPLAGYLVATTLVVSVGYQLNSRLAFDAGIGSGNRAWIDDAVGRDSDVAVLWTARGEPVGRSRRVWESEFFNRSVGPVYYLRSSMRYDLPETRVRLRRRTVVLESGRPLRARYVLTDGPAIAGSVVATKPLVHLTLYRVSGEVVRVASEPRAPRGT